MFSSISRVLFTSSLMILYEHAHLFYVQFMDTVSHYVNRRVESCEAESLPLQNFGESGSILLG
jgi:hypothetical protein